MGLGGPHEVVVQQPGRGLVQRPATAAPNLVDDAEGLSVRATSGSPRSSDSAPEITSLKPVGPAGRSPSRGATPSGSGRIGTAGVW